MPVVGLPLNRAPRDRHVVFNLSKFGPVHSFMLLGPQEQLCSCRVIQEVSAPGV